ncbi:hypothetical protein NB311A_07038 [Nitrobacter sp. Nb-311A]|nr:hypothetical protein NB311A_07038 [Nitrobacter sp. Nb-311A]
MDQARLKQRILRDFATRITNRYRRRFQSARGSRIPDVVGGAYVVRPGMDRACQDALLSGLKDRVIASNLQVFG